MLFFLLNITFVLLRRACRANTSTRFTEINSALLAVIDMFLTSNERYVLYFTFFLKRAGKTNISKCFTEQRLSFFLLTVIDIS